MAVDKTTPRKSPSPSPSPSSSGGLLDVAGQYNATSNTNSKSSTSDPPVYLGSGYAPLTGSESYQQLQDLAKAGKSDQVQNLSSVQQQYYDWDDKTRNKFLSQLSLAGYNVSNMQDSDLASAWSNYATQAAAYYKSGNGKKLTPWDIMAIDRRTREAAVPTTTTATNLSYDMSSKEDAHALFLQASQSLLGRAPTGSEISQFQKQLNVYEKKNPTKTTTTTTTSGTGNSTSNTNTSGGVSATSREMMASDEAKQGPEFGAYQASTTYFNALLGAIGSK
jgi:hypothetical protein